jgi:hypothetical protein
MRNLLLLLSVLLCSATPAVAQVSVGVGIALPGLSIGINLPAYPQLARVPGYPVYYAPGLNANFFFYDGLYWVYQADNWYASSWYNGPWGLVGPQAVPVYILRVPVRYYRQPPPYFGGWGRDAPPRWGDHWGRDWEQSRGGWDRWDRKSVPPPAPLPTYQRQYSGQRYPQQVEQQQALRSQHYRYQPRDEMVRQHDQQRPARPQAAEPRQGGEQRQVPQPQQGASQRQAPAQQQGASQRQPPPQPPQQQGSSQRQAPMQQQGAPQQDRQPSAGQGHKQQAPQQGGGAAGEPGRGPGQEGDRGKGDGRGQDRKQ